MRMRELIDIVNEAQQIDEGLKGKFAKFFAALAATFSAAPALAQNIGVIDTSLGREYAQVESRNFIPDGTTPAEAKTADGRQHGAASVDTILAALKNPDQAHLFHANIMASTGNGTIGTSWARAMTALDWFKKNNVTLVCTNFVLPETEGARQFIDHAEALGLKIVASVGNGEYEIPYPAVDPRVIAVGPDNEIIQKRLSKAAQAAVKYKDNPFAAGTKANNKPTVGTSFSAARRCGKLGNNIDVATNPDADKKG